LASKNQNLPDFFITGLTQFACSTAETSGFKTCVGATKVAPTGLRKSCIISVTGFSLIGHSFHFLRHSTVNRRPNFSSDRHANNFIKLFYNKHLRLWLEKIGGSFASKIGKISTPICRLIAFFDFSFDLLLLTCW
jgi:hypothetical protein